MNLSALTAWMLPRGVHPLNPRQSALAAAGAFTGLLLTALICGFVRAQLGLGLWLMAPLGASAVQVFCVPASPLAQPWPVIAGHTVSALAGLLAFALCGHTSLGAALAVGLAAGGMLLIRGLHPSGGGTALFVVLSQTGDWRFALFPVAVNAAVLVAVAMAWHRLTGLTYPHRPATGPRDGIVEADLEAAIAAETQFLDIDPADLKRLIAAAERHAEERRKAAKGPLD